MRIAAVNGVDTAIVRTRRSLTPMENSAVMVNRSRRVQRMYERTRAPKFMRLAKRKMVTPSSTRLGTGVKAG